MSKEIEELREEMRRRDETHANEMAEMRSMLAALQAKPPVVMQAQPTPEKPEVRLEAMMTALRDAAEKVERELLDGTNKYRCSCSSQPMLTKTVGARDQMEAQLKYMRYSGIIGVASGEQRPEFKIEQLGADGKPMPAQAA